MNQLLNACEDYLVYPKNIIQDGALDHTLRAYIRRLREHAIRLFVEENDAALNFLDLNDNTKSTSAALMPACVHNLDDLRGHLREALRNNNSEPICRFISIHAAHSRAPLNISYEMFCFLCSYLQIPASFLDFIFPFGDQEHAQDFYFTAFREETVLQAHHRGLSIPQLGRSGREMKLCFNLRSVEESPKEPDLRWSIRQTAVYHTFDFDTGKSVWVNVKGNTLIKRRISELTKPWDSSAFRSISDAFKATLKVHLLLCDWSMENWRWYINELEERLRTLTQGALQTVVGRPPSPITRDPTTLSTTASGPTSPRTLNGTFTGISRVSTWSSLASPSQMGRAFPGASVARIGTLSNLSQARTIIDADICEGESGPQSISPHPSLQSRVLGYLKELLRFRYQRRAGAESTSSSEKLTESISSDGAPKEPEEMPRGLDEPEDIHSGEELKFSDLQRTQYIEEKTHQVALVLELNLQVLQELRQHYATVFDHSELPSEIRSECGSDIARFIRCVGGVEKDIRMQRSRTETLLRLLAERKTFLYGILQYQSMRSSEKFAEKAHESSKIMEGLTNNMNTIAQKTKQETVSMRIITLVTLFFLPGTFIGTFMSTDIVKFETNNEKHFQSNGLWLYLEICLPLMMVTFIAWFGVYKWANKEKRDSNMTLKFGYSNNV